VGTPVYFSSVESIIGASLVGGIIQGKEYFITFINSIDNFIRVSEVRAGPDVVFTNDTGRINLMQWKHEDPARLYVTVNGRRIPSDYIKINDVNEVSILTKIVPGDQVIITSMIPTSTPNELRYLNIVDSNNQPSVYRIVQENTDWLVEDLSFNDDTMFVRDVTKLTNLVRDVAAAPAFSNGFYNIGLTAERNLAVNITVTNETTGQVISPDFYSLVIQNLTPTLRIVPGAYISEGDRIVVETLVGNPIYVNGEIIKFTSVDFEANTISGLLRGTEGTGQQTLIPAFTNVYSLATTDRLPDEQYFTIWNTFNYNTTLGDPLQISQSAPANFLNRRD